MSSREYFYAESLGDTTGTGSSATPISMSADPTTNGDWFFIATCAARQEVPHAIEVVLDASASAPGAGDSMSHHILPNAVSDYFSCPLIARAPGVPAGVGNIFTQLSLLNDVSGGAFDVYHIRECTMLAIKAGPYDSYATDGAVAVTTSNTGGYDDILTLTVPADFPTEDYVILAVTSARKDTTASNFNVRLNVNGTLYADAQMRAVSTSYDQPFFDHTVASLAAGNTVKIQGKVTTSGTARFIGSRILIMRASDFAWYKHVSSRARVTTSSSTYREVPTDDTPILSDLIQDKPIMVLSSCLGDRASSASTGYQRSMFDTTQLQESNNQPTVALGENAHAAMTLLNGTGSSLTPTQGYHEVFTAVKTDGGALTAGKSEAAVTMIQLSDACTVRIKGNTSILGATNIL